MKINHKIVAEHLGVKLRGNETFDELLKIEQQVKEHKERQERIAEEKANIQRVDAQTKKYWGKK
jgi:antirestriction protein